MKIILTSDVDNLGEEGDVTEVKDGYARNYLLPQNLAIKATAGNLKLVEQRKRAKKRKEEKVIKSAEELASKLESISCTIPVNVGEEGKLFGSVTSQNISEALGELGYEISRKDIELEEPIRNVGTYHVPLKLHPEVSVDLKVDVVPEESGDDSG